MLKDNFFSQMEKPHNHLIHDDNRQLQPNDQICLSNSEDSTSIKSCLLDVNWSNYNRAGMAVTVLSGLMVSMEQSRGLFFFFFR